MPTSSSFPLFSLNTAKSPNNYSRATRDEFSVAFEHVTDLPAADSLVHQIRSIILNPHSTDKYRNVSDALSAFPGRPSYVSTPKKLDEIARNASSAYYSLTNLESLPTDLEAYILELTGDPANMWSDDDRRTWGKLWDNLTYQLLQPNIGELRNELIHAIQLYRFLATFAGRTGLTLYALKQELKRIPIVPFDLAFIRRLRPASEEPDEEPEFLIHDDEREDILTKLPLLNTARSEISKIWEIQKALALKQLQELTVTYDEEGNPIPNPDPLDIIDSTRLSDVDMDKLDSEIQELLEGMGYTNELIRFFDKIISKIDEEIKQVYKQAFPSQYAKTGKIYEHGIIYDIDVVKGESHEPHVDIPPYLPPPVQIEDPCKIKPLGIIDYRKVEATWKSYEPGEIAHIENLLKGESKDRETRNLRKTEESYTIETIREKEVIRDLQTTERFALQKEASEIVQQDFEARADAYVKGSYGTVTFGISGGISVSNSSTKSTAEATQYAKEVVDRSVNRILERTREERTVKIIEEYEETNIHKLDNSVGTEHVTGVYRWVDKIMHCQLANYGKRLLLEFMVPEPAAFFVFAKTKKPVSGFYLSEPKNPVVGITNPITNNTMVLDISNLHQTYLAWAAAYGVEIEPYPTTIQIGTAITGSMGQEAAPGGHWWTGVTKETGLKIPEGYASSQFTASLIHSSAGGRSVIINVGNHLFDSWWYSNPNLLSLYGIPQEAFRDVFPISVLSNNSENWALNVKVFCEPTQEWKDRWAMKAYNTIMMAYEKRLSDYKQALREAQVSEGIQIDGDNPLTNREIEKTELRKGCIQLLNSELFMHQFDAMKYDKVNNPGYDNYPYFDNCEAAKEGRIVNFFETVFDWNLMSYFFQPYFYANRSRWVEMINTRSADPLFASFLQAGYARVVVPVRLGFEQSAMNFIESGTMNVDALLVALNPDVLNAQIELDKNTMTVTDPNWATSELNPENWPKWEVRLPTNLVILQESCPVASDTALPINPNI